MEERLQIISSMINEGFYGRAIELTTEMLQVYRHHNRLEELRRLSIKKAVEEGVHINYRMVMRHLNPRWSRCTVKGANYGDRSKMWWFEGLPVIKASIDVDDTEENTEENLYCLIDPSSDLGKIPFMMYKEIWSDRIKSTIVYYNTQGFVITIPTVRIGRETIVHMMGIQVTYETNTRPTIGQNVLGQLDYMFNFRDMLFEWKQIT